MFGEFRRFRKFNKFSKISRTRLFNFFGGKLCLQCLHYRLSLVSELYLCQKLLFLRNMPQDEET